MFRLAPLAALIALALSLPATAGTQATPLHPEAANGSQAAALPRVEVTALSSDLQLDVPGTTTVIERAQMDRHLVANIRDLVRYEPGVSAIGTAGRFGLDSFNIRGLSGNRSRIEVDGVSMPASFGASVADGSFRAGRDFIDLDTIDRVDIVRGPASALYPSDSLGGVVSLHTKDPDDYLKGGRHIYGAVKEQYDSRDRSLGSTVTLASGDGGNGLLFVLNHREGHDSGNKGDIGGSGSGRTRPDPLSYRSDGLLGKYVHTAASGRRDRVILDLADTRTDTDSLSEVAPGTGFYRSQDLDRRLRLSIGQDYPQLHSPLADRLHWQAYWQRSHTRNRTQTENATTLRFYDNVPLDEDVLGGKLVATRQLQGAGVTQTLSYGVELSRTRPSSRVDGYGIDKASGAQGSSEAFLPGNYPLHLIPKSRTERYAVFAQDKIGLFDGRLTLTPGVRVERYAYKPQDDALYAAYNGDYLPDDFEQTRATPKLGVLYRFNDVLSAYADYAQGFRPPLFSDIAGAWNEQPVAGFNIAYLPSPNLKAETSRGLEAGLRGRGALGWFSVGAYYNRYRHFIWSGHQLATAEVPAWAYQVAPTAFMNFFFQAVNARRAVIKGAEASGALQLGALNDALRGWAIRASASIASGKLIEPGDSGYSPLNTVDPARLVLGLSYDATHWGAELVGTAVRRHTRLSDPGSFRPAGYGVVDAYVHLQPLENLTLYAGVDNLTDRKYWDWGNLNGGVLGNFINGNGVNDSGTGGIPADRLSMPGRSVSLAARWSF